jgi:ABC-2 type transport system ATP-binding protein
MSIQAASLECDGLLFAYSRKSRPAVSLVNSITFPQGRTALLGPNGAGKSTLLSIIAGGITPQRGVVRAGGDVMSRPTQISQVAWLPQAPTVDRALTSREYCAYQAWLKGTPSGSALEAADKALALVGLSEQSRTLTHRLSVGTRARLCLAGTLATGAKYLLLDEPMAALDPAQRRNFLKLIRDLAEERAIIVSTHDVLDLDQGFDHVVVLQDGRCVFGGSVESFLTGPKHPHRISATEAYVRLLAEDDV